MPLLKPAGMTQPNVPAGLNLAYDPTLTWTSLEWLRSISPLPIVLKGILRGDDAARAVEHGADGVLVSNHGGRELDTSTPTLEALPEVVEAVDGRIEVYIDGGVRRGTDVLKALALGARAVLVGRQIQWALATGGDAGIVRLFELMTGEFTSAMALCGARTSARSRPRWCAGTSIGPSGATDVESRRAHNRPASRAAPAPASCQSFRPKRRRARVDRIPPEFRLPNDYAATRQRHPDNRSLFALLQDRAALSSRRTRPGFGR